MLLVMVQTHRRILNALFLEGIEVVIRGNDPIQVSISVDWKQIDMHNILIPDMQQQLFQKSYLFKSFNCLYR